MDADSFARARDPSMNFEGVGDQKRGFHSTKTYNREYSVNEEVCTGIVYGGADWRRRR
jgi:hypothetical protein